MRKYLLMPLIILTTLISNCGFSIANTSITQSAIVQPQTQTDKASECTKKAEEICKVKPQKVQEICKAVEYTKCIKG